MTIHIRKVRLPEDYPAIAAVLSAHRPEPTTVQRLQDEDAKIPAQGRLEKNEEGLLAGFDRHKIVAETADVLVIGYGVAWRAPWTPPGELHHTLAVLPGHEKRGAGSALYADLERWAEQVEAAKLVYMVKDDRPDDVRFAERRGFTKERHVYESVLSLAETPASREEPVLERTRRAGIRFTTLAQLPREEGERRLYELYRRTTPDIPGNRETMPAFGEWRKWCLELPGSKPKYTLLAMDGDRIVGVANLVHQAATNSFYHEYTGVLRDYRGRGIALSLKRLAIRLAAQEGAAYLRTNNDSQNGPMLSINLELLGYRPVPGYFKMVKTIGR
ncbi:GNAT family N-acetyltransferase [Paenibacillus sp. P25]|nr:GNAT family N-acetyltransferase [Paenibacillus sp. P25]